MRVYVERDRQRLRIRVIYQGKKHQFSTGLMDTKANRAFAQGIASRIELDMISGQFDSTMVRYRPQVVGSNPAGVSCAELFRRFTKARRFEGLSNGALEKYKAVEANLERHLKDIEASALSDRAVGNFVATLQERVSNGTARQYLYLLRSAWDWGKGQCPVKENPWTARISKVKPLPRKKRKPFTELEIQAILKGFKQHRHYKHYYPFVLFQLNCGTRPGESSSRTWADISEDFSTALIRRSHSRGVTRQKTKTGINREISLNPTVQALLKELCPKDCDPSALI